MRDSVMGMVNGFTIVSTTVMVVFLLAALAGLVICRHRWRGYVLNLLIAVGQGINTLCGGSPDETISSACYRFGARIPPKSRLWRWAYRGVNLLFFWQVDHCRGAYNSERERKHLPDGFKEDIHAEQHPT